MAKKKKAERKRRRRRGEGSIFQRKNGSYSGYVTIDQERHYASGETFDEVHRELTKKKSQFFGGTFTVPEKMTVREHLKHWMETDAKVSVSESSYDTMSRRVENYIIPHVGDIWVQSLNEKHVQRMNANLAKARIGGTLRANCHGLLRQAMDALVPRVIPRNPCNDVKRPREDVADFTPLDQEQTNIFLSHDESAPLYTLFVVAILSGARRGELLALGWKDVDFATSTISIRRTLYVKGKVKKPKPVKTAASRRKVILPRQAMDAIHEQQKRKLAKGRASTPFVFFDRLGGAHHPSTVRYQYKKYLKSAGLPDIRFHDLRHTHATLLLMADVNLKVVQERLGHSSIRITSDTYSHVMPTMQRSAADKLGQMFA